MIARFLTFVFVAATVLGVDVPTNGTGRFHLIELQFPSQARAECSFPPNDSDGDGDLDCNAGYPSQYDQYKNLGVKGCTSCGNPINYATGNKYQEEIDYIGPGPFPLVLKRYYNSLNNFSVVAGSEGASDFGFRWSSSYTRYLIIPSPVVANATPNANEWDGTVIQAIRDDGSIINFTYKNGLWAADADVILKLSGPLQAAPSP
jgi:hypothetical protein